MRCPGQDSQYWTADAIYEVPCPECGALVEFFRDDGARTCPACKNRFANPKLDFGCAAYCPHAAQCIGVQAGREQELTFKEVLMETVKEKLGNNKDLWHKLRLLAGVAEELARSEGAPLFNVLGLGYLHTLDDKLITEIYCILKEKQIDICGLYQLLREKDLVHIEWQIIEDAQKIVASSSIIQQNNKKELKNIARLCHTKSGTAYFEKHN